MTADRAPENGWREYQRLVLFQLEGHTARLEDIDRGLERVRLEIAMLKLKSGLWGAAAGALAAIGGGIGAWLLRGMSG